jgi:hypothetical protein
MYDRMILHGVVDRMRGPFNPRLRFSNPTQSEIE